MSVVRRFLIVPALARLIRKERGGSRITEGYFAPQGGRTSLVRIDGQQCHLVLISTGTNGAAAEERTEVPRAHGDALLDVCGGKAVYERTTVTLSPGRDILLDRYVTPTGVDLISVSFDDESASRAFRPPSWFGTEVSTDAAYERHAIALEGPPEPARLSLNNAMLDAVLDLLEPRFGLGRFSAPNTVSPLAKPTDDDGASRAASSNGAVPPRAANAPSAAASNEPAPAAEEPPRPVAETQAPPAPTPVPTQAKATETSPDAQAKSASGDKSDTGGDKGDARIDDVIESLSQALGAAIQQPPEAPRSDDLGSSFERWQVRPRRTQQ